MKLQNLRLGFATNSSSTHSFIYDPEIKTDDYNPNEFGWDDFTLSSKSAKKKYLMAILNRGFENFPKSLLECVVNNTLGIEHDEDAYIDHQSLIEIPKQFGYDTPSLEFFKEFSNYILKEGLVILGGNDNCEEPHHLYDAIKEDPELRKLATDTRNTFTCRKDGEWWTVFNHANGAKLTISFSDNPGEYTPLTPVLIDLKITDFCSVGCAYCYQGSTKAGEESKINIWQIANMFKEAEVFEVAIGGGEPTEYPQFLELLENFKKNGITPNFTTKKIDWLEDEKKADAIINNIGGFAYSYNDSYTVVDRILDIFKYRNYPKHKFSLQIIPAIMNEYEFSHVMQKAYESGIRVTLLGYKTTGRGRRYIANGKKFDESKWLDKIQELIKEHKCPSFSIDTALASKYQDKLIEKGIPKWTYHIEEGKYSMYIDAVKRQFGPSSYHHQKLQDMGNMSIASMFNQVEAVV